MKVIDLALGNQVSETAHPGAMADRPKKIRATGLIKQFVNLESFLASDEEGYAEVKPRRDAGRITYLAFHPCGDGQRGDTLFEPRSLFYPELIIYRLRNVKLMMPYHILWHESGVRLCDITIYNGDLPAHLSTKPSTELAGEHVIFTNNNYGNYCHWLTECLPSLVLGTQYGLTIERCIMPPLQLAFQRPSIHLFGVDCASALQIHSGVMLIDSLTFLSYADHSRPQHIVWPEELVGMAARLKRWGLERSTIARPRFIYISRMNATRRRCLNEAALEAALVATGFQSVVLEALPIEDQIALFSDAEIVVGLHGAGLTNAIYCRPSTLICEIQPASAASSHFFRLLNMFGLRQAVFRQSGDSAAHPHAAWTVDVDELMAFLQATKSLAGM